MVHIRLEQFDAFIFDLDGVVTRTAAVHAAAWKRLFDEVLPQLSDRPWAPFDERDYRTWVDGKPRLEGIRSFLASRRIFPDEDTLHRLAARKNQYLLEELKSSGVEAYADAVTLIRRAKKQGVKVAVVSASENCAAVLEAAGLARLFEVRVDGLDALRFGLKGKPAPDTFLEAARRLGCEPRRAVIFEDAISGAKAGRAGGFGLVVGVARNGRAEDLRSSGADLAVTGLGEIALIRGRSIVERQ